jgi:hypothetical protein
MQPLSSTEAPISVIATGAGAGAGRAMARGSAMTSRLRNCMVLSFLDWWLAVVRYTVDLGEDE